MILHDISFQPENSNTCGDFWGYNFLLDLSICQRKLFLGLPVLIGFINLSKEAFLSSLNNKLVLIKSFKKQVFQDTKGGSAHFLLHDQIYPIQCKEGRTIFYVDRGLRWGCTFGVVNLKMGDTVFSQGRILIHS